LAKDAFQASKPAPVLPHVAAEAAAPEIVRAISAAQVVFRNVIFIRSHHS
jgi:hypothetical protein